MPLPRSWPGAGLPRMPSPPRSGRPRSRPVRPLSGRRTDHGVQPRHLDRLLQAGRQAPRHHDSLPRATPLRGDDGHRQRGRRADGCRPSGARRRLCDIAGLAPMPSRHGTGIRPPTCPAGPRPRGSPSEGSRTLNGRAGGRPPKQEIKRKSAKPLRESVLVRIRRHRDPLTCALHCEWPHRRRQADHQRRGDRHHQVNCAGV